LDVWALCGAGSFSITNSFREGIFSSKTYPGHVPYGGEIGSGPHSEDRGSPGIESWVQKTPFLILEADGKADNEELQIYVRKQGDEEAQKVSVGLSVPSGGFAARWNRLVRVVPLAFEEGDEIAIDIVVSRSKQFEFLVAPPKPHHNQMAR